MKKLLSAHILFLIFWGFVVLASVVSLPDLAALTTPLTPETKATSTPAWGRDLDHATNVTLVFTNPHGPLTSTQRQQIQNKLTDLQANLNYYNLEQLQTVQTNGHQTNRQFQSSDGAAIRAQAAVDLQANDLTTSATRLQQAIRLPGLQTAVTSPTLIQLGRQHAQRQMLLLTLGLGSLLSALLLAGIFRSLLVPLINLLMQTIVLLTSTSLAANSIRAWQWPFSPNALPILGVTAVLLSTLLTWTFMHDYWAVTKLQPAGRPAALATLMIQYKRWLPLLSALIFIAGGLMLTSILTLATNWILILIIIMALLAVPPLNYALMILLGDSVYWPGTHAWQPRTHNLWLTLSHWSNRHPAVSLCVVALMLIPGWLLARPIVAYQQFSPLNLAHMTNAERGQQLLTAHFGPGAATPVVLTISNPHRLTTQSGLQTIDNLTTKLQHLPNVAQVTSVTQPGGTKITNNYLASQFTTLKTNLISNQLALNLVQKQLKTTYQATKQPADTKIWARAQKQFAQLQATTDQLTELLPKLGHQPTRHTWQRATQLTTTAANLTTALTAKQTQLRDNDRQRTHRLTQISHQTQAVQQALLAVTQTTTATLQLLQGWQASQLSQSFYLLPNTANSNDFLTSLVTNTSRDGRQTQLVITLKTPATQATSFKTYTHIQQTVTATLLATPLQTAQLSYTGDTAQQAPVHQRWQQQALIWLLLALAIIALMGGLIWRSLTITLMTTAGLLGVYWSSWGLVQTGARLLTNQAQLPWLALFISGWFIALHWLALNSFALNWQTWRAPWQPDAMVTHFYFTGQLVGPLTLFELGWLLPLSWGPTATLQAISWLTITGILMSNLLLPCLLPAVLTWNAQPPHFKFKK
ncbi:MMPL family transporter [Lactiplantibacillus fabifermentans]|nr:MMPL family transporter [Lactiplantibacillus fabifermentans]